MELLLATLETAVCIAMSSAIIQTFHINYCVALALPKGQSKPGAQLVQQHSGAGVGLGGWRVAEVVGRERWETLGGP